MRLLPHDGPAEGAAELLLLGVGLVEVGAFGEEVTLGQARVLEETESAAAEAVGALLGHGVDHRARRPAELRVELTGQHLELLDRLDRRPRLRARALPDHVVVVVRTVEHVVVVPRVLPVDADRVGAERLVADVGHDAGQQPHKADEVAVDRRQLDEIAVADVPAHLVRGQVDEGGLAGHDHLLGDATHRQRDVHGRCLADPHPDVLGRELLESGQLRRNLVATRPDTTQEVGAVRVADGFAKLPVS